MNKYFGLIFLFLSFGSYAEKPTYDQNCVPLGKKWGWIKTFDPADGHKRTYSDSTVIDNAFSANQNRLIKQLEIWKDVDKTIPCLKDHAGVTFHQGSMVIFDMQKFSTFRLNGSKINCLVTSKDTRTRDNGGAVKGMYSEQVRTFDPRIHMVADALDTPKLREQNLNKAISVDMAQAEHEAAILREKMRQNNNFGDLGMDNYCSHQLRIGIVMDKAQTMEEDLKRCDQARLAGNNQILKSALCEGYPKKNVNELKKINSEMLRIRNEKKGWQPLVRLNKADNDVYSMFEDNFQKLQAAKKLAAKSMNLSYGIDNFYKSNNVVADLESVLECGHKNDLIDNAFLEGKSCETDHNPLIKLKTEFRPDIKVLKKIHEQNLISEMNAHAYGSAIKSKFYLLKNDDPLRSKMYHKPQEACEAISGKEMCKGLYFQSFKKSVKEAWNYQAPHFLSYAIKDAVGYYNDRLKNMTEFCNEHKQHQQNNLVQINPEAYKRFEDNFRQMISGPLSPYLYDSNIRYHSRLSHFRNDRGEYCQGFSEKNDYAINEGLIENARKDFEEATDKQLKISAHYSRSDRGGPSNVIGAQMCQMSLSDKNDSFALNSLYESHPYLAGKILKSLEINERRMYASVICEARECNVKVDNGNDTIKTAATVALIAANLVPVYGSMISFAGSMALGVGSAVNNKLNADDEIMKLKRAIATEGLAPVYKQKIGDILKDLSSDASIGKLMVDVAFLVATETAILKGGGNLTGRMAQALKMRGIFLNRQKSFVLDLIMEKALVKVKDVSKENLAKAFEEIKDLEIVAPDFKEKDVDESHF